MTRVDVTFDIDALYGSRASVGAATLYAAGPAEAFAAAPDRPDLGASQPTPVESLAVFQPIADALAAIPGVASVSRPTFPPEALDLPEPSRERLMPLLVGSQRSPDWRLLTIHLEPDAPSRLVERVRSVLDGTAAEPSDIELVGLPVLEDAYAEASRRDLARLIPIVLAVFGGLLAVGFRRLTWALIPLASLIVSGVLVAGTMGWAGVTLGGPNIVLLPLVLVLGLADSVHVVRHFGVECGRCASRREALERTLDVVGPACLATTVTTSAGFFSLCLTSASALRVFGAMAGLGLLLALVAALTVPSTLLSLSRRGNPGTPPGDRRSRPSTSSGRRSLTLLGRRRGRGWRIAVPFGLALATLITGATVTDVETNVGWGDDLPPDHPVQAAHRRVDQHVGGLYPLVFHVNTGLRDGVEDIGAFRDLDTLQRRLSADPEVGFVVSFVDVVGVVASAQGLSVSDVLGDGRDDRRAARRYRRFYQLGRRALEALPDADLIDERGGAFAVHARLGGGGARAWSNVLDDVAALDRDRLEHVEITAEGAVVQAAQALDRVLPDLARAGAIMAVFALAVLMMVFRSVAVGLITFLPLALTTTTIGALMVAWSIPLGYTNLFMLTTGIGVGVDAMIHLMARHRLEYAAGHDVDQARAGSLRTVGVTVIWNHGLLVVGLMVLMLSQFSMIRTSATVLAVALTVNLVATLLAFDAGAAWLVERRAAPAMMAEPSALEAVRLARAGVRSASLPADEQGPLLDATLGLTADLLDLPEDEVRDRLGLGGDRVSRDAEKLTERD